MSLAAVAWAICRERESPMRARFLVIFGSATMSLALAACFEDATPGAEGVQARDSSTSASGRDAATSVSSLRATARGTGADASVTSEVDAGDDAASNVDASDDAASDVDASDDAVSDSDAGDDAASDSDAGIEAGSACGAGAGTLDQSQLGANGNIVISSTQSPSQTITVGSTGILTGIEFGLASCNGVDPASSIVLTLSRGGTVLATASIGASSISTVDCGSFSLSSTELGAGYYDLEDDCIAVAAGDQLTAAFTISGPSATCSSDTYQCVGGANDGRFCEEPQDCEYAARLGMQGDVYSGGSMWVNGTSYGWDAAFKTFIR